jgi:hypothetical protein
VKDKWGGLNFGDEDEEASEEENQSEEEEEEEEWKIDREIQESIYLGKGYWEP